MSHKEPNHEDWVEELHAQLERHPTSQLIINDDDGPSPGEYEITDCQFMPDNTIRLAITKL